MAGSLSAQRQTRLSVRAATEPLPTPLPPPPRVHLPAEPVTETAQVHSAHSVPPRSHVNDRPSGSDPSQPGFTRESLPDRSLRSPSVVIALAVSSLLLAAIGWYQISGRGEERWPPIDSVILEHIIEPSIVDSDLPYITDLPLVPARDTTSIAEHVITPETKETDRITLSNSTFTDTPSGEGVLENQWR